MMFIGLLFAIALIAGIVLLVIWGARASKGEFGDRAHHLAAQTPQHTLRSRYARGEINQDQYLQMLQDLP
jgi:uncharacterized membrane protein